MNKFIDEFFLLPHLLPTPVPENEEELPSPDNEDFLKNYSFCILKYILLDYKDAVKEGNGERLATLHKVLLPYFKSLSGSNAYAIAMLISVVQNEICLSNAEGFHCKWASTANWKGGSGKKNIEIDLLQENRNKDIKQSIKMMGASKTVSAIERSSRSSGGERQIVENYDQQLSRVAPSSSHSHRPSTTDEVKIMTDFRELKPFNHDPNRKHGFFPDIVADPLAAVDHLELEKWLRRHQRNLMHDAPLVQEEDS